jgi:hypothetical protein
MRRSRVWTGLTLLPGIAAAALAVAPGCNSDLANIGQHCSLNSDCDSPLICVFTLCHEACKTSVDCPMGERCVPSGNGIDDVCQLPAESTCEVSACNGSEICGADLECRVPCTTSCTGDDACATIDGVRACYDPENPADQAALLKGIAMGDPSLQDAAVDSQTHERQNDGATSGDVATAHEEGSASDATTSHEGGGHDAPVDTTMSDGPPVADGGSPVADGQADAFVPNPDDGILGFNPSNVTLASVDAGLAGDSGPFAKAPDVSLSGSPGCGPSGNACGFGGVGSSPITVTLSDGNFADLYVWNSFALPDTASLTFTDTNPVILVVLTTVSIQGQIYVNDGNAGGFSGSAPGPGAGQGGNGFASGSGGAGGSFCGVGGLGGSPTPPIPAGGPTYGFANLVPLVAGSAGGENGGGSGAGGGAIQIVAGQSITVGPYASINAGGEGSSLTRGGGSGGAILLEAPAVVIQGTLAANGGGGGGYGGNGANGNPSNQPASGGIEQFDGGAATGGMGSAGLVINGGNSGGFDPQAGFAGSGGGGAGRIRINTATGSASITGTVSPAQGTACMTQGTLSQ